MKTITLSPNEIKIALACLAKQPYEEVATIIDKISQLREPDYRLKEGYEPLNAPAVLQMHEPGEPVVP